VRALALAAIVLGLAGCGGGTSEKKPVAYVAGQPISREHLDQTVERFQEEAKKEGRLYPHKGTGQYRAVQKRLLELLVYRKEIELAAARIGVHVSDKQVEARMSNAGSEPDAEAAASADTTFLRDTARYQLLTEGVTRKLTRDFHVTEAEARAYYGSHRPIYGRTLFAKVRAAIVSQLLTARRNAALTSWLAAAQRRFGPKVRYALKG
jgi:hypothetical protein